MPRGRPRKNQRQLTLPNPLPVEVNDNVVGENTTPIVNESSQPTTNKKTPSVNPNQICMACGTVIPDTPNKLDLAMWLDAAPYKFNTKLNDKGRIILCHKCENHLIETIDEELKKMGCKQKFESGNED